MAPAPLLLSVAENTAMRSYHRKRRRCREESCTGNSFRWPLHFRLHANTRRRCAKSRAEPNSKRLRIKLIRVMDHGIDFQEEIDQDTNNGKRCHFIGLAGGVIK